TGAELLRKIKVQWPDTIRIMLTGHADVNAVMGAVNEGAVYKFITKPWNNDDLRLTVRHAVEQFELLHENESLKQETQTQKKQIDSFNRFVNQHHSQLGPLLIRKNLVRKEDMDRALLTQEKTGEVLPKILIQMNLIEEAVLMQSIQHELGIPRVDPTQYPVSKEVMSLIPQAVCERNLIVPLKLEKGRLTVAMVDPSDFLKADELKFMTGFVTDSVLATTQEVIAKLTDHYGTMNNPVEFHPNTIPEEKLDTIEFILDEIDDDVDVTALMNSKDAQSALQVVNAIISEALRLKASDVHIEPKSKYVNVRYRIDGMLYEKLHIPIVLLNSMVSRIKIMCELDITERRKPQDGRLTVKTTSRMVDMRISTLPTVNGEKVVMRILDRNATVKDIKELGLSEGNLERLMHMVAQPQGILLSTGPTGSGKTTMLYSLLRKVATSSKNFTTIEDPVEYNMEMAEQVHVQKKIGLTFPVVLRSLLRQDPDVIMLGEIRDLETAEVAFHAAMTGHLVLSTLHTNNAPSTITRLKDMGLAPYVITDSLVGAVAQRLVRRLCPYCKSADQPPEQNLHSLKLNKRTLDFEPQKGTGCDKCHGTGYNGRMGIFEIFPIDAELKKMITLGANETDLVRTARLAGMKTLYDDAMDKLRSGLTSCEEVLRVLGPQNMTGMLCKHCGVHLEERFQFCHSCGERLAKSC
ncbi:MAG: ATPase, T2SS/T4P/T4SS family, partial [Planctomycetota bacterium]